MRAFTVFELLVVIAIIAVLAAVAIPGAMDASDRARESTCAGRLRNLGSAIHLYCQDHGGAFPRSFHSAAANREPGWAFSVAPYLGAPAATTPDAWKQVFNRWFRCPSDTNSDPAAYSYGLNVYFELDPLGDDYAGSPATWRHITQVPRPSRTILLAETKASAYGDHFMCHQWSGASAARNAIAHERHSGHANFLLADGHLEKLAAEATFSPPSTNRWNPSVSEN